MPEEGEEKIQAAEKAPMLVKRRSLFEEPRQNASYPLIDVARGMRNSLREHAKKSTPFVLPFEQEKLLQAEFAANDEQIICLLDKHSNLLRY